MKESKGIYQWIIEDIKRYVYHYMMESVIIALVIIIVMIIIYFIRVYSARLTGRGSDHDIRKPTAIHIIIALLFSYYFSMLLCISYFSREPGSREAIHLNIFNVFSDNKWEKVYALENIILFIPFGFFLPSLSKTLRKFHWCILLGLLGSFAIEGIQFITKRGYSELDDILNNFAGTIIGYLFFGLLYVPFILIKMLLEKIQSRK